MASSKIKNINIKIGADTRGLDTALKGIENKSKSAKNELSAINGTLQKAPESLTVWKQKQELLTKAIENSREKVELLENAQEQVAKQLADGKISDEQYRAFQRELEKARAEVSRLDEQLYDTNKKIDEIGNSAEESGKSAEKASDGYTVFKDVLGNLVTQGINLAIEKVKAFTTEIIETGKAFEASMSNVGVISGATGDELEKLSEKARQMGATTKYTASQSADAFGYMALAGWETEDMLAGIDGVLSLAAASNMDLAKASDIVTDYLTAFGLTAQDSSKFVDQMSYAMSKSNTTTELLGEAYKNCAATAASMGYSVEETTAVLMTMANAGVKGGEAGTALNAIMTRLATNTQGCATALKKYADFDIYQNGKMQNLSNILEGVSDAWETLDKQEQATFAKQIAGTNHYSALQTIMNGLSDSAKESRKSFTDYASALEECDGTAQNMADTMIDNLAGDMTILDSSIDGVKIALADKLNPIIRDLVQYITEKMPEIQKSSEKALDTVVLIAEWCRKHMLEIKETAKDLIPYIVGIGSGFAGWNVATKVTSVVNKLFGVVKSGSVYMKLLNAVMSANPAVAVTTAIVGLTGAFVAWKKVQEDEVSIADKVNEKYKEQTERIQGIKDEIENLEQSSYDSAAAIDDETQKTKDLWKELHNLAGESGEVLDADRKRAGYILGELNEALGTEYTMTGNQIENYQTLAGEIDKVIEKKHAEALLDAALAQSAEMAEQKRKAKNDYLEQSKLLREAETAKNKAFVEFSKSISGTGNSGMTAEEIKDNYGKEGQLFVIDEEQYNAAVAFLNAKGEIETIKDNLGKSKDLYDQAVEYENKIRKAQEEIYGGNYDIEKILYPNEKLLVDKNATKDEKLEAYNAQTENLKYLFKIAIDSDNQSEIDSLLQELTENLNEGQELGLSFDELFNVDTRDALNQIISKGYNISEFTKFGKDSGIDITKFFGPDYSKIFSAQIQKDYNVDDFIEWAALSETKIAKESWDDAANYIQKRLDEGFNVEKLIENGAEAGIDWGEAFNGNYMDIIQKQINNGFDPTKLIESWAEVDEKAAEDFKKNSIDVIQKMLDKGFDPTNMMQWFLDNGVDGTKLFTDEMKKEFEKADFSGIKLEGLFNHLDKLIEEKAAEEAEVYGKYFTDYINQYKYHKEVESGKMKPNSKWDADLYSGKVNYGLNESSDIRDSLKAAKFATGGYISAGNSGIIAEAGPELIEVMNGGVRITPMREKARNTEVSDNTAGQKIFYNTYNLNNPRISNDMDVRQIAQKLAIEQRRIERGRGIF